MDERDSYIDKNRRVEAGFKHVEWTNEWTSLTNEWTNEWTSEWTNAWTDAWTDEWTNGPMHGPMNGPMNQIVSCPLPAGCQGAHRVRHLSVERRRGRETRRGEDVSHHFYIPPPFGVAAVSGLNSFDP